MAPSRTPTLERPPESPRRRTRGPVDRRIGIVSAGVALLAIALLAWFVLSSGVDIDVEPTPATDAPTQDDAVVPEPDVSTELPQAVNEVVVEMFEAARSEDWDRLAALAMDGETPFTATFGEEMTSVDQLATYWRGLATEEDLPRIITGLLALPDWTETTAVDASGVDVTVLVTPGFMHQPSETNRAALVATFSAEWLETQIADGQYLGWRIGITPDGDWRFLVQGD